MFFLVMALAVVAAGLMQSVQMLVQLLEMVAMVLHHQ
jgi:hypothetical protein